MGDLTGIGFNSCPDNPLEVTIADDPTPQIDVEVECIDGEVVQTIYTDGVAGTPTVLGECDDDTDIDVEYLCQDSTGTIHAVTFIDGAAQAATVDTLRPCPDTVPECVKWSSTVVFIDNTGTRFNESHEITITNVDGTTTVVNADPTSGWTPQLNEWQSIFAAAYPDAVVEVRCNTPGGCGGLLPAPADAQPSSAIVWRYLSMIHCPTDQKIPVKAEITDSSNLARIGHILTYESISTPEKRGYRCATCNDGYGSLKFDDGTDVPEADLPVCTFACAEEIPAPPVSACEFDALEGGCDNVNSEDENGWLPVTRVVSICDGSISASYYTEDPDGGLNDYELVGEFVDCDSGTVVPEPPVNCASPTVEPCFPGCEAYGLTAGGFPLTIGEGGLIFNLPEETVTVPAGEEFADAAELVAWLNANTSLPWTAVLDVPGDGFFYVCLPLSSSQPTLQAGDDDPIDLIRFTEFDEAQSDDCAELTKGCNDDRRDDLLQELVDSLTCEWTPTGTCLCYESAGGETYEYVNADNATEITLSDNSTTIKWAISLGQEPDADGTGPFIADCIASGQVASIEATTADGITYLFDADAVLSDGSANGGWAFTGAAQSATGSGKVTSAIISCGGAGGTGIACQETTCTDGATSNRWVDAATGEVLTDEQAATLAACQPDPECATELVQVAQCADGDGEGVADGDQILLVYTVDCDGVAVDAQAQNLTQGVALDPLPNTIPCDPEPEVEEVRECIVDTAGTQWSQVSIIDSQTEPPTVIDTLFINSDTLTVGTPAGDPSTWMSCPIETTIVAPEFICATVAGVPTPFLLPTNVGPYVVAENGQLVPATGEVVVDPSGCGCKEVFDCPDCPDVTLGDITNTAGDALALPFSRGGNDDPAHTEDAVVPFAPLDAPACLTDAATADPAQLVRVRVNYTHSIDPSQTHTGFGASVADGAVTYDAVDSSNGNLTTPGGYGFAPHPGAVGVDRWIDYDVPLGDLLAGNLWWQTSGFGTIATLDESETIHRVSLEFVGDAIEALCDCDAAGACC